MRLLNLSGLLLAAGLSSASAATITSYDIFHAMTSGFGNWSHTYGGTITLTGASHTVHGFTGDEANYSGGSGTLNDGVLGTAIHDTQLFNRDNGPVITVHLDQAYTFGTAITLFSFAGGNSIPGTILGLDVTINGVTATLSTTNGPSLEENITLTGTSLDGLTSDTVQFSNFQVGGSIPGFFAISEITIDADVAQSVPDSSASTLLVGLGLALCASLRRRPTA